MTNWLKYAAWEESQLELQRYAWKHNCLLCVT